MTATGGSASGFVWDLAAGVPLLLGDGANRYVYGPDGTALAQYPLGGGPVTYLHTDAAGSVRAATDAGGAVTGTWDYDPYGNTRTHTGATVTPLQYGGQYKDPTGLYYLRARYYDPVTAQFLTRDPLQDATNSPYGYTSGNPLQDGDPLGLYSWRDSVSFAWNEVVGVGQAVEGIASMVMHPIATAKAIGSACDGHSLHGDMKVLAPAQCAYNLTLAPIVNEAKAATASGVNAQESGQHMGRALFAASLSVNLS